MHPETGPHFPKHKEPVPTSGAMSKRARQMHTAEQIRRRRRSARTDRPVAKSSDRRL